MKIQSLSPSVVDVLGGHPKFQILVEIYHRGPMSVQDLQNRLGLSYMGIKQHCDSMQKAGFLTIEKQAKGLGRPRHAYVLTLRGREVFTVHQSNFEEEILSSIELLYGRLAVEKILFTVYATRIKQLSQKFCRFSLLRRIRELASMRRAEGFDTRIQRSQEGLVLTETTKPIEGLLRKFPIVANLERSLFEHLLQRRIHRTTTENNGYEVVRFFIDAKPSISSGKFVESTVQSNTQVELVSPERELPSEGTQNKKAEAFFSDQPPSTDAKTETATFPTQLVFEDLV